MAMKIMPKTLPGSMHNLNKGSCDWGWQGLVAYGCQNAVVIVDPISVQVVQVLDCRSGYIVKVKWARENYRHNPASPYGLRLAAADHNGHIYIWDAVSGKVGADCCDGTKPVSDMEWVGVQDISHDLLLALHPPYHLVLWNTENGSKLWRKTYADLFQSFSFDPFDPTRVAFLGQDFVVFVDDFSLTKAPHGTGKKFFISSPSSQVTSSTSLDRLNTEKRLSRSTLRRVSGILIGESARRTANAEEDAGFPSAATTPSSSVAAPRDLATCLQLEFHKSRRHHLILLYSREILILDLEINQTVGVVSAERTGSPFAGVVGICQRDALFCLHENGAVALRAQRNSTIESSPCTQSLFADSFGGIAGSGQGNELVYEHLCQSDALRVTKHSRVMAVSACPVSEKRVALILSTGRILIWEVQAFSVRLLPQASEARPEGGCPAFSLSDLVPASFGVPREPAALRQSRPGQQSSLKFMLVGLLGSLHQGPLVIRMCPPLTTRNFDHYQPLLAVGSSGGIIQVFNLSGGQLYKELSVHSFPVRGIEWVGLRSFLSYAYQNPPVGGSGFVRNELMLTELDSGRSIMLRGGTNEEEPPIESLKVSYLKQYFCLYMKDRPLEIWDARTRTVLRQMPKNFPSVTALEWSPSHNIKNLKKKPAAPSSSEADPSGVQGPWQPNSSDVPLVDVSSPSGQSQASTPTASEAGPADQDDQLASVKEHFVFTDTSGLLYHYIVEGSMIKKGSEIPPDASMGSISGIAWKSETLVLTDTDGNMNIWDLKGRISRTVPTGRGGVKKVKFAPGRGNMKLLLLFSDGVDIWDAKETVRISSVKCPRELSSISAVDWAASDRPVLACADGTIRITDFDLSYYSSTMEDNQVDPFFCPHALVPKAGFLLKTLIQHQPWRSIYSLEAEDFVSAMKDALSQSVMEQMDLIDPDLKRLLSYARFCTPERCLLAAKLFGDESEFVFWSVALFYMRFLKEKSEKLAGAGSGVQNAARPITVQEEGSGDQTVEVREEGRKFDCGRLSDCEPLETCFDILCENSVFKARELARVRLHESKRGNGEQARRCADSLILLGQTDRAVQLLLETEPDSPNYYADSLKACLAASIRSSGASQSTIKLVATNLIANGQLSEGIQLLCMIDKGLDACRYLQTYGKWFQAAWLAKVSLDEKECTEVLKRWADHLASPQVDQKDKAILVLLSLGQFERAFELMYSQRYFDRAALFLESCQEFGLKLNGRVVGSSGLHTSVGEPTGIESQSAEWTSMVTSTYLEYARTLHNFGLDSACDYFCKKAGPKGKDISEANQTSA